MRRFVDPRGKITSLSFSRDNQLLAATAGENNVFVWDAVGGEVVQTLEWSSRAARREMPFDCTAFAPGADLLAASGSSGIEVWHTTTWLLATRTEDSWTAARPTVLAWDPGLVPALAFMTAEETVLWSLPDRLGTGLPLSVISSWHEWGERTAALSGDGFFLAVSGTHSLGIWNAYAGTWVRGAEHAQTRSVGPICFAPDSSRIAFGRERSIEAWPFALGDPKAAIRFKGHTGRVRALRYTPDGRTLISASSDGTVRTWEAATGLEKRCFDMKIGKIAAADVSPGGTIAAVGGAGGEIVVWDLE